MKAALVLLGFSAGATLVVWLAGRAHGLGAAVLAIAVAGGCCLAYCCLTAETLRDG